MNIASVERVSILLGCGFAIRAWATWRAQKRKRADFRERLVDGAVLEAVFNPRPKEKDDSDLLDEMRDTFSHLNRRAYAEEFWGITDQLVTLEGRLEEEQKGTMRRAVIRLITADDRWLQLIGARTAVRLHLKDAAGPLRTVVEGIPTSLASLQPPTAADVRYKEELEDALRQLDPEIVGD